MISYTKRLVPLMQDRRFKWVCAGVYGERTGFAVRLFGRVLIVCRKYDFGPQLRDPWRLHE